MQNKIIYKLIDSAIWEREPNRKLKILTDLNLLNSESDEISREGREVEVLRNSHIERLDINFVSGLKFDKIGNFLIFIGPYPQNEEDIENIANSQIDAVLNVQTDLDMQHRQINWNSNLKAYVKHDIEIVRHPIRDFDQSDLIEKLKEASDILKNLLENGYVVYVHCTAGMSRAAATVIAYLVFYHDYTLEEAHDYVKSFREIICPNLKAIETVIKNNS